MDDMRTLLAAIREQQGRPHDGHWFSLVDRVLVELLERELARERNAGYGWVCVPREPTEAMIEAGSVWFYEGPTDVNADAEDAWGAMIDAALKEPVT